MVERKLKLRLNYLASIQLG